MPFTCQHNSVRNGGRTETHVRLRCTRCGQIVGLSPNLGNLLLLINKPTNPHSQLWEAGWFRDGKPDPEIVDLFGTHVLPTPFPTTRAGLEVIFELAAKNPNAIVRIGNPR